MSNKNKLDDIYNTHHHVGEGSVLGNPFLTGKLYPLKAEASHYIISGDSFDTEIIDGEPVPPLHLRENYGFDASSYLQMGRNYAASMAGLVGLTGAPKPMAVLDWGCAAGRVLRFLPNELPLSECWGCDINMQHILWAQMHLSDKLSFVQCTTAPSLPFADERFDFIYALSVFTHVSEIPEMWFAELNRILKPRGTLFVTIHDEQSVEYLVNTKQGSLGFWLKELITPLIESGELNMESFLRFSVGNRTPAGVQMFYRRSHLLHCIKGLFQLEKAQHRPFTDDYQTGLVLKKI